jgi:rubrerythrin
MSVVLYCNAKVLYTYIIFQSTQGVQMVHRLKKLALRLVLENAIIFEEKAYHYYDRMEEKMDSEAAKALVKRLKAEELRHQLRLKEAQREADLSACCSGNDKLFDSAQRLVLDWPQPGDNEKQSEILRHAYEKEKNARDFYRRMKRRFPGSYLKKIFGMLAGEEEKHMKWISSLLER